jgi:hypothetical protein
MLHNDLPLVPYYNQRSILHLTALDFESTHYYAKDNVIHKIWNPSLRSHEGLLHLEFPMNQTKSQQVDVTDTVV